MCFLASAGIGGQTVVLLGSRRLSWSRRIDVHEWGFDTSSVRCRVGVSVAMLGETEGVAVEISQRCLGLKFGAGFGRGGLLCLRGRMR